MVNLKRMTRGIRKDNTGSFAERGAYVIEVAIVIPLLFGFIFAAIDVAKITSGYSAVRMATALGSRWAVGVNRVRWKVFKDLWATRNATTGLIPIGGIAGTVPSYYKFRQADVSFYSTDQFLASGTYLTSLYEMELRAIAYGNDVVRRSVGDVKYPCRDQPSCLACFTIRKEIDSNSVDDDFTEGYSESGNTIGFPVKMLGLRCDYNVPISSSSITLGWLPQFITVRSTAFVPINDYANIYYDRES